jgi:hypothetical protein
MRAEAARGFIKAMDGSARNEECFARADFN